MYLNVYEYENDDKSFSYSLDSNPKALKFVVYFFVLMERGGTLRIYLDSIQESVRATTRHKWPRTFNPTYSRLSKRDSRLLAEPEIPLALKELVEREFKQMIKFHKWGDT